MFRYLEAIGSTFFSMTFGLVINEDKYLSKQWETVNNALISSSITFLNKGLQLKVYHSVSQCTTYQEMSGLFKTRVDGKCTVGVKVCCGATENEFLCIFV